MIHIEVKFSLTNDRAQSHRVQETPKGPAPIHLISFSN